MERPPEPDPSERETLRMKLPARETLDQQLKIRSTSLAERCEICHKSDQFDPAKNFCSRCQNIALDYPGKEQVDRLTIDRTLNNLANQNNAGDRNGFQSFTYAIGFLVGLLFYLPLYTYRRHRQLTRVFSRAVKNFFLITRRNRQGQIITRLNRITVGATSTAIGLPGYFIFLAHMRNEWQLLDITILISLVFMGFVMGALIGAATEK